MTVVAVTSSRTSPGATSLAAGLALAWKHQVDHPLLIEADPSGGVLSLRFDLDPSPSLTTFGSDIRNRYEHDLLWSNTQDMRGIRCLTSPVDPRLAASWIERIAPTLVTQLPTLGSPVAIDLGRVGQDGASLALAEAADITLIVTSPQVAEVQALLFQARRIRDAGGTPALVTVGSIPNEPAEIAAVAGIPLVAVLPDDAVIASALCGSKFEARKFRRSLLWRTIGGLANSLFDPELMLSRASYELPQAGDPIAPAAVDIGQPPPPGEAQPAALQPAPPQPAPQQAAPPQPAPQQAAPPQPPPRTPVVVAEVAAPAPLIYTVNGSERRLVRPQESIIVGRKSDCSIVILDERVSRRHGRIRCTPSGWHYADLGSKNGSLLNGEPCTDVVLATGDELTIGPTVINFETAMNTETECA